MDKYTLQALNRLLDYVYDAEYKHFQESDEPKKHIFNDIKLLVSWVDDRLSLEERQK